MLGLSLDKLRVKEFAEPGAKLCEFGPSFPR
jgi:hypothetical protein